MRLSRTVRYFLLSMLSLLWGCRPGGAADSAPSSPNILLFLADDLGHGDLGSYGQEKIKTPHLDALAAGGMRFTQHYSGSPVCAPSRCVLLTGKHSGHAYIRGNDEWRERGEVWDYAKAVEDPSLEGQRPLPAGAVTLGSLLQRAGYRTALVGKWGLGGPLTEGIPNLQGFDFFFGYNCQRQAHSYYPMHLWRNRDKVLLDNRLVVPGTKLPEGSDPREPAAYSDFELNDYAPDLMIDEALDFIESNRSGPFFLYFATPIPHVPLQAPKEWIARYVAEFGDEEPYLGDQGYFPHRYPRAAYAAMVSYMDDQMGRLVARLKELEVYDNTLILFSSDNGPTFNGGSDTPFFDSARPFKSAQGWGKGTVREGGIRVPMLASWPGRIRPGARTDHVSAFYDLLPTICDIVGIEAPSDTDGISFKATLLGEGVQAPHEALYWEFPSYGGQQAVRMGRWKGVRMNLFEGNLEIALHDLETDPQEQTDLSGQFPEVVAQIRQIMEREHVPAELESFRFQQLGD